MSESNGPLESRASVGPDARVKRQSVQAALHTLGKTEHSKVITKNHRSHKFSERKFDSPTWCEHCRGYIFGIGQQKGYCCDRCRYTIHNKCAHFSSEVCVTSNALGGETSFADPVKKMETRMNDVFTMMLADEGDVDVTIIDPCTQFCSLASIDLFNLPHIRVVHGSIAPIIKIPPRFESSAINAIDCLVLFGNCMGLNDQTAIFTIISMCFGADMLETLRNEILDQFLGEMPTFASVVIPTQHSTIKNLIYVSLGFSSKFQSPMDAYQVMWVALGTVHRHNKKLGIPKIKKLGIQGFSGNFVEDESDWKLPASLGNRDARKSFENLLQDAPKIFPRVSLDEIKLPSKGVSFRESLSSIQGIVPTVPTTLEKTYPKKIQLEISRKIRMAYTTFLLPPAQVSIDVAFAKGEKLNSPEIAEESEENREIFLHLLSSGDFLKRNFIDFSEVKILADILRKPDEISMELHKHAARALATFTFPEEIHSGMKQIIFQEFLPVVLKFALKGDLHLHREISPKEVQQGEELGDGEHGTVSTGVFNNMMVAIRNFQVEKIPMGTILQELAVMSILKHENLISVFGGNSGNDPFIVMEFCRQGNLADHLSSDHVIDWKKKFYFQLEIAKAMQYLHSVHLIHGHLNSSNVFLTATGGIKVGDYGCTPPSTFKLEWHAPEIFAGDSVTSKIDVYSFGIVMWEIATRLIPWKDKSSHVIKELVGKGERPGVFEEIPRKFQSLMKSCWSQKSKSRPDFDEIVEELKKLEASA